MTDVQHVAAHVPVTADILADAEQARAAFAAAADKVPAVTPAQKTLGMVADMFAPFAVGAFDAARNVFDAIPDLRRHPQPAGNRGQRRAAEQARRQPGRRRHHHPRG